MVLRAVTCTGLAARGEAPNNGTGFGDGTGRVARYPQPKKAQAESAHSTQGACVTIEVTIVTCGRKTGVQCLRPGHLMRARDFHVTGTNRSMEIIRLALSP